MGNYHITHDESHRGIVSDYYPLTKQEIAELLRAAQSASDNAQILASIQCRLLQAIKGSTCPAPSRGTVAERMEELGAYFVSNYGRYGSDPTMVDAIDAMLNS